jgi:hypothetical protein
VKRLHTTLAVLVLAGFLTALLVGRSRSGQPLTDDFTPPVALAFEPLVPQLGEHALRGVVLDAEDRPVEAALVAVLEQDLLPEDVPALQRAFTDERGEFTLSGLPAGPTRVVVVLPTVPNTEVEVRLPTTEALTIRLPSPYGPLAALPDIERVDVRGRLTPPAGIALADWPLAGYEVVLAPAAGVDPLSGAVERRVTVDAEGGFEVPRLAVAAYRLRALPPWARGGTWPWLVDREYVPGAIGSPVRQLEVPLTCGEIVGQLSDHAGRPIDGALVTLRPELALHRVFDPAETDAEGRFHLRDVPAGVYLLHIRAGAAQLDRSVTVAEGARVALPLPRMDPRPPEDPAEEDG